MFIHKSIEFFIVIHNLHRIIKHSICIHIFCRNLPFTSFLCYLMHSIIANSLSINIKLVYILTKEITGRIKFIQIQHNLSF